MSLNSSRKKLVSSNLQKLQNKVHMEYKFKKKNTFKGSSARTQD